MSGTEGMDRGGAARRWAAACLIGLFAVLVGRFWDPCYGFTKFFQFDSSDVDSAVPEMRKNPVYVYPGYDGYDGYSYAEIAYHPLLDTAQLGPALGNVPYRARRILGSALAWILSGGRSAWIADVYGALNPLAWLVLAAITWKLLPVKDWRSWGAWAAFLLSCGALHSVRLALTDLPGVTLLAGAVLLLERRRNGWAISVLALGGLARETILAGAVALWRKPCNGPGAWRANAARTAAAAAPLLIWMAYVRWKAGPAMQGVDNFTWPVVGWVEKWGEIAGNFHRQPHYGWLNTATLLATIALTVQAAYLICRPNPDEAWWRVGAGGVAMMACFGTSVWEGHPGAAERVLLPMSLAFTVIAVRQRAAAIWLIFGNLSILSGILALGHVPEIPGELAAGRAGGVAFEARLEDGWYGLEEGKGHTWAWTAGRAGLVLRSWSQTEAPLHAHVAVRALGVRSLEIRANGVLLWNGQIDRNLRWIEFDGIRTGLTHLDLSSEQAPVLESAATHARELGFAVYGLKID